MKLVEYQGKRVLASCALATPDGAVVSDAGEAAAMAESLGGPVVVKAQVPSGKRGKSGAIRFAETPSQARDVAGGLLDTRFDGYMVNHVLVERAVSITKEFYAAVLNDPDSKGPLVLFSTEGGVDIEELHATRPEKIVRVPVDIRDGLTVTEAEKMLAGTDLDGEQRAAVTAVLTQLYRTYREHDAELVEVNPLALTDGGEIVAVDAKVSLDPGAFSRNSAESLRDLDDMPTDTATPRESEARESGLQLVELEGEVGVLANGAGLTMTTLDAVNHYGGRPANFLEIGGEAYTKATAALRLVLNNPNVRSLLINFCGAFARTDVMTEGVIEAIETLQPDIGIFFTIHGTGERAAVNLVHERLGVEPYEHMDDAVRAAVAGAATSKTTEYEGVR